MKLLDLQYYLIQVVEIKEDLVILEDQILLNERSLIFKILSIKYMITPR